MYILYCTQVYYINTSANRGIITKITGNQDLFHTHTYKRRYKSYLYLKRYLNHITAFKRYQNANIRLSQITIKNVQIYFFEFYMAGRICKDRNVKKRAGRERKNGKYTYTYGERERKK